MNAKMLPRLQLLENFSDPESQEAEKPDNRDRSKTGEHMGKTTEKT